MCAVCEFITVADSIIVINKIELITPFNIVTLHYSMNFM